MAASTRHFRRYIICILTLLFPPPPPLVLLLKKHGKEEKGHYTSSLKKVSRLFCIRGRMSFARRGLRGVIYHRRHHLFRRTQVASRKGKKGIISLKKTWASSPSPGWSGSRQKDFSGMWNPGRRRSGARLVRVIISGRRRWRLRLGERCCLRWSWRGGLSGFLLSYVI